MWRRKSSQTCSETLVPQIRRDDLFIILRYVKRRRAVQRWDVKNIYFWPLVGPRRWDACGTASVDFRLEYNFRLMDLEINGPGLNEELALNENQVALVYVVNEACD